MRHTYIGDGVVVVCDCCGWGVDALTGKITYEGMGEDAEDLEQEIEVPDEE